MKYDDFIKSKIKRIEDAGFEVSEQDINSILFDFQNYIVRKALKKGRFAIFANTGLGKTFMQLEWALKVKEYTNKPVLLLAPLAVSSQTIEESKKLNIEVVNLKNKIFDLTITNYEQLKNIDCSQFSGVVLDESSILKSFTGAYRNLIIEKFADTPYKLACTATPSPNDMMEICNHAEFLNYMKREEMLAMYFVHDGGCTSKWRLKGHAKKDFYSFLSSFSVMVTDPGDLGFTETSKKYQLPPLNYLEYQIDTKKKENGKLFNDSSVSATELNRELKEHINERMQKVAEIVNNIDGQILIWIKLDDEGKTLRKLIPEAIEVKGSDKPEYKEKMLLGFAKNDFRVMITKTKIAQFGLNYQNCQNQIFASLDFSFEGLYQAIRRSYRFGQDKDVNIHLITLDTMQNVYESIQKKEKQFLEMRNEMQKEYNEVVIEKEIVEKKVIKSENYTIINGDCVQEIKNIPDKSVGFSIFSPPFAELYTYSSHIEDMGNAKNYKEFMSHFEYLVKELSRIIQDGRNIAVHCMDLPIQKGKEGYIGLRDFSGMLLKLFLENRFIYHSRVTIWKDPVIEMQRTKALGLLHKQVKKDSSMSRVGIPDYLMIFRKEGENQNPIKCKIDVDTWQKYASPVWNDINYSNTLNRNPAREYSDEKHICPLQLDTIKRAITLWSNPGDVVFTPFMGIGSEVYSAVKMDRKGIGIELKESYFNEAVKNIKAIEENKNQMSLF